jgi:hypothetical protein
MACPGEALAPLLHHFKEDGIITLGGHYRRANEFGTWSLEGIPVAISYAFVMMTND